jgi:hypothetical protein
MLRLFKKFFRPCFSRKRDRQPAPQGGQPHFRNARRESTASSQARLGTDTEATNALSLVYFNSAQKLRRSFPDTCIWLEKGDLHVDEGCPVRNGRYANVRKADLDGRNVAIKSHRCYINFKLDETRMVSCRCWRDARALAGAVDARPSDSTGKRMHTLASQHIGTSFHS